MALLPLSAVFEHDFVSLLVVVDDADTVEVVGRKIAHHVVGRRLPASDTPVGVRHNGRVLAPETRIGEIGVGPLDHVEAFFHE
ncbi:toluene-4-monooxygenase system B family protein [Protofrankia symbiont of Coriaria ruscifolia]|uniref:toluene-4-monooxygenase system B family protein n=1 Tax=Protofrankia symbiont of Coriaria ruscifolia TaxID=1306542 RepID=UPI000A439FD4|nr:toluene-4-monooxygenase system B family protein [Protofrankia symbiont of Coriaria ruscifolia]